MSHFNDTTNAIKSNGVLSEPQKQKEFNDAFSKFTNDIVSYGQALGIPNINPVPATTAASLNDSYNINPDPSKTLSTLDKYTHNNATYLANTLKDPVQGETLNIVNNLRGKQESPFMTDMLQATAKGHDFSDVKSSASDNTIKQDIISGNSSLFTFIGSQPGGQQRIASILKAGVNYVKFSGQKGNDLSLDNLSDYEENFKNSFAKSISLDTGSNFDFNNESIPTTHAQSQALGDYLTEEVRQSIIKSEGSVKAHALFDQSPLRAVSTPDGHIIVMNDRNTVIGKKVLFTSELMSKAEEWETAFNKLPASADVPEFNRGVADAWARIHPASDVDASDINISNGGPGQ